MKPKRIILVRHGESQGNVDKNIYLNVPDYAIQLTPIGRRQAFQAGEKIKEIIGNSTVKYYISPYWRARQTYQEIVKSIPSNFPIYETPVLREQEWGGSLEDRRTDYNDLEEARDKYGHFYYRLRNGEAASDVFDRISDFCNTLHRDFEKKDFPQTVIIVCHGMTMRLFLMRWFHYTVEEFEILANPRNGEFWVMELNDKKQYDLITQVRKYPNYTHPHQFRW